jgi:hypothetical protein
MNLDDFEEEIDGVILDRGRDYYQDGCIESITHDRDKNTYTAVVAGSQDYTVTVKLDRRKILFADCDCPYDWGPFCKHQVAVFYALQENLGQDDAPSETPATSPAGSRIGKSRTRSSKESPGEQYTGLQENMSACELCHISPVQVHLEISEDITVSICMECNNKLTAEYIGIKISPFQPGIYEFMGISGKKHKFNIYRNVSPCGIGYEANEVTEDGSPGFTVAVMDGVDCDQQVLFEKLKAKIKRTIFKRYLETSPSPYGGKIITLKNSKVVGRFEYNEDDEVPKLVIDGKEFSWDEFGRMLNSYEGFQLKLEIMDITDDIK